MSTKKFQEQFSAQNFNEALSAFDALSHDQKIAIFSELFQKCAFSRNPHNIK